MLPIPIRTDNRLSRRPWVNYAIIAINVAIFLGNWTGLFPLSQAHLLHPFAPQLQQFFTSIFLHAHFMHLAGNMLFLWVFGNSVNDRFGHVGYLAFYLAGGVLAGVGYTVMGGQAPVLGASGAIAGVTGCYLVLFPRVRVLVLWWLFFLLIPFEVTSIYLIGIYFIYDAFMTLTGTGGQVAYTAHVAGYVYGIGMALALLGLSLLPRDVYDLLSLIKARRRRSSYRRMVQGGYNPYGPAERVSRDKGRPIEARTVESTQRTDTPSAEGLRLRQEIARAHGMGDFAAAADRYLELVNLGEDVVLPRQQQLDVANQLMSEQRYAQAADAYERLLRHYPQYEHIADIQLMLGIIYGRYLRQGAQAIGHLKRALEGLHDRRKIELARSELTALGAG